jgi:hypothetical protein
MQYFYEIIDGQAIPLNDGPEIEGRFTNRYVRVDGNKVTELKWLPKDQRHLLKLPSNLVPSGSQAPVEFKPTMLTKLEDLNFSDELFRPMATCSPFDNFVSNDGGIMPGSNLMAAGAPGVGKTTVLLELLHMVRECDPSRRVLFISAEMTELDMARYLKRFPHWKDLPILFTSNLEEQNPKLALEAVLNEGWDLVLTDSYTEINDTIKEECNMTRSKTEKWFLDLMNSHNKGMNKLGKYTAFITILQLSKGGNFVGSNKLKHMTSAMMSIDWKGGENSQERYLEFSKNRLGQVGHRLFFNFDNGVTFDEKRYQRDLLNDEMIREERAKLGTEADAFDRIFATLPSETESLNHPAGDEEKVEAENIMG